MERTTKIVLGDWSDDGHGKTETYIVKLRGKDISDEALAKSYLAAGDLLQTDLSQVCEEYEDYSISASFYEQLLEAGFSPSSTEGHAAGQQILVEDIVNEGKSQEEVQISAVELVMFYTGFLIEDFEWELVSDEIPVLLGGGNTILKQRGIYRPNDEPSSTTSFGYGFFL